MKSHIKLILLLLAFMIFGSFSVQAKLKPGITPRALSKVATGTPKSILNANNVTSWIESDGFFNWEVAQSWNGEFPKASGVGTIFSEGIVFGGLVNDGVYSQTLRVTGDTYFIGMQPGKIITDATGHVTGAEDVAAANIDRVWAIRPDMPPTVSNTSSKWPNLSVDAGTFYKKSSSNVTAADIQAVATQYFTDWNEWPASKGAPWYVDSIKVIRNDASFDPANPHHIPGIPGASKTAWFVCNDMDPSITGTFAGSPPIGIEEQMTLWSYASSTPLNNILFKQVKLIYKGVIGAPSTAQIDSMYICQWADPDNGDAGDDYAGSDSLLNIGFAYNSKTLDAKYAAVGLPAPATGYAFLQGVSHYTGVATDSAVINLTWRKGYKYWHERALTTFDYFAANSGISDPDDGTYDGTQQWFNLLRGYLPRPQYPSGSPFYSSSTYAPSHNIVTPYCLSGDPVAGTGWIDGIDLAAGDRRIVNVNGPFTLKLHDTAEVVIALVDGMGADNLSSVKVLKYNTTYAQFAYNSLFNLPSPPPSPIVSITNLSNEVILNWSNTTATTIEASNEKGFLFQGYVVYQLPSRSAAISDGVKIATYDIAGDNVTVIIAPILDLTSGVIVNGVVETGSESGIKRIQDLNKDYIRQGPLVNGQEYYYAVTAYSYNPNWSDPTSIFSAPFPSLESAPIIITAIPQMPNPGYRYSYSYGDTIKNVRHESSGVLSDGSVVPIVVAPDKLTGDKYQVKFDATTGNWQVVDSTKNTVLLTGTNQTGDADYLAVDGIQVIIKGPLPGMKGWDLLGTTRRFSPVGGFPGLGLEGFSSSAATVSYDVANGTIGMAGHLAFGGIGTTLQDADYHTVKLVLAAVDPTNLWNPLTAPTDTNFSLAYRFLRASASPAADPSFVPWIIHSASGYPYQDYNYAVPFSAWDMETTPPSRLAVGMFENNVVHGKVDGRWWPDDASIADNTVAREFCFIFKSPYTTTADPALSVNLSGNSSTPLMWVMTCVRRNTAAWPGGDEFEIIASHINTASDVYTFTAPAPTYTVPTAKVDVDKINVFPNPYYGFNARETSRLAKYVKFSHLPANATIRIFNLAGVLVKTIRDYTGQFATWNLMNESSLPVASGIYIVHVDMPDLGKSKILKLAIVQEEQILPIY